MADSSSKNGAKEPLSVAVSFDHWTVEELIIWHETGSRTQPILNCIRRLAPVKKWNREGDPNDPAVLEALPMQEWMAYYRPINKFLNGLYNDGARTSISAVVDISHWTAKNLGEWQDHADSPNELLKILPGLRPFKSWNREGDPHDAAAIKKLPAKEYIDLMRMVTAEITARFQEA